MFLRESKFTHMNATFHVRQQSPGPLLDPHAGPIPDQHGMQTASVTQHLISADPHSQRSVSSQSSSRDDNRLSSSHHRKRKKTKVSEESSSSSVETSSSLSSPPSSSDSEEQYQKKRRKKKKHSRPSGSKNRARSTKRLKRRDSNSSASSSEPRKRKNGRSHSNKEKECISPMLKTYKKHLQACYEARNLAPADKYLPTLQAKYTNLAMITTEPFNKEEKDEFTKATLHGGVDQILEKKSPITITDLLTPIEDGKPVRFVLVEGPPGIGKSTFAWEVCKKWDELPILRDYHAVVLVRLRERWALNATSLPELFRYRADPKLSKVIAKQLNKTQGVTLLLVLDGFDEVSHSFHEGSVLKQILRRELLPKCTIILTTRPSAKSMLDDDFQPQKDKHIEIVGFTEEQRREYITNLKEFSPQYREKFLEYMFQVPHIKSMMYIPLNCAIIAKVYSESQESLSLAMPKTRTQLYKALTNSLLMRYMAGKENTKSRGHTLPEGLPEEELAKFSKLARFAFESYHSSGKRKITFFKEDIPDGLEHFGFMNESTEMYAGKGEEHTYTFLHLSLQEYLAAWHLAKNCSIEHQIVYHQLALNQGVKDHDYSEEMKDFVSKLKPLTIDIRVRNYTVYGLNSSLVEPAIFLAGITGWRGPSGNNPWETYVSTTNTNRFTFSMLLQSLYESQNPEICKHYIDIMLSWEITIAGCLTPASSLEVRTAYDCYALSYFLSYFQENNNPRLNVTINNGDTSLVEMFSRGVHDHCDSKTVKIRKLHLSGCDEFSFDCLTSARHLFDELEELTCKGLNHYSYPLPPKLNSICRLLENRLTELSLQIRLTPSVYDVGLQSATASYVNSVLKSILVSKQITKLSLPYVTRDTMINVQRMLVECGNLVKLELRSTRLGYDGILYICSALRDNTTLTHLTIHERHMEYPTIQNISRSEQGEIRPLQYIPLPNIATCTTFLLELNDILKDNTTLKELSIWSGSIFSVLKPAEEPVWRKFTGHGPLQQFNMASIESLTPHTLRRSYSLSDVSQPQTDIVWCGKLIYNVKSTLRQVMPKGEVVVECADANVPWKDIFEQFFSERGKEGKSNCSSPSYTAPDTDDILQSFTHLDPRLKECLGISHQQQSFTHFNLHNLDASIKNFFGLTLSDKQILSAHMFFGGVTVVQESGFSYIFS